MKVHHLIATIVLLLGCDSAYESNPGRPQAGAKTVFGKSMEQAHELDDASNAHDKEVHDQFEDLKDE